MRNAWERMRRENFFRRFFFSSFKGIGIGVCGRKRRKFCLRYFTLSTSLLISAKRKRECVRVTKSFLLQIFRLEFPPPIPVDRAIIKRHAIIGSPPSHARAYACLTHLSAIVSAKKIEFKSLIQITLIDVSFLLLRRNENWKSFLSWYAEVDEDVTTAVMMMMRKGETTKRDIIGLLLGPRRRKKMKISYTFRSAFTQMWDERCHSCNVRDKNTWLNGSVVYHSSSYLRTSFYTQFYKKKFTHSL